MGLVVANPAALVALGNLHDPKILLGVLGFFFFIIVVLAARNIFSGVFNFYSGSNWFSAFN